MPERSSEDPAANWSLLEASDDELDKFWAAGVAPCLAFVGFKSSSVGYKL
jgi:hypothetical protein